MGSRQKGIQRTVYATKINKNHPGIHRNLYRIDRCERSVYKRSFQKDVNEGALYHHERYDGKGYPEGKAGEEIPLIARMICVADAFDAMNSNRVYRNKLTKEDIINEIEKNKGKQFDPKIADIFLRLIKDRNFDFEVIPNPGNGSTF